MKTIYVFLFVIIPSGAFAQSMTAVNNLHSTAEIYQPDPFTTKMLKADNPCNNRPHVVFDKEYKLYKDQACRDYVSNLTKTEIAKKVQVSNDPQPYLILTGATVVISIFIVIAV